MEKEDDVDQLFKRGLSDPEIPFNELDWDKMARKLDAQEKKRVIPLWIFTASGIAAVLTIFLFWIFSAPVDSSKQQIENSVVERAPKPGAKNEELLRNGSLPKIKDSLQTADKGNAIEKLGSIHLGPLGIVTTQKSSSAGEGISGNDRTIDAASLVSTNERSPYTINPGNVTTPVKPVIPQQPVIPLTESELLEKKANALAQSKDPLERINHNEVARSVQQKMESVMAQDHHLILSAMAAPDITSGPSSKSAKISSNLGMLATYALGSKFSLTSGAIYSKKYYNSGGSTSNSIYSPKTATDWEVKADCNVLDIPLNVNYKLMNKKSLAVSVNTGLSSYFMLKEKYQYITGSASGAQEISNTEFDNKNQHIFGIANVSVSFDHQISQNLSVGVQPFAKLPLTGIGNNDVNLKSTGVSFSISIGLFPAKKPGKLAANRYSSSGYSGL